ncbi:hypothetical protein TWF694_010182 [Orbilia ellipsospora]|uniref:Cep57 centrosome microtubule-binding domain-containing protein n=1 Tax=Orbilia ellipsospora TaxID=2528407 RepID=A0AAV9XBS1_9PEZI
MESFYHRSPSQSTTHGSYVHDSDQDAHDLTRLRLQQQLARDLASHSDGDSPNDSTVGSLNIMGEAAAMSTRRLDDILPPSTPTLDSKLINANFKDFSTIGVGVRARLFPHLSNNPEDSAEIGRGAAGEHTKTDKSSTFDAIFRKDFRKSTQYRQPAMSPNTRARMQPSAVDESMELSSYSIGSRLQGGTRRTRATREEREQLAKKKLDEASKKENVPVRPSSQTTQPIRRSGVTSAYLNTEKLFKGMGMTDIMEDDDSAVYPASPSIRKGKLRAAAKPAAPSQVTAHSIKLPDMTGISDLVSSVNHEMSTVKRTQHFPIESVPVPEGERDLLIALKKLQKKVEALESDKAKEKKRGDDLERDYEQTRQLYQIEFTGRQQLEAELNTRKRADSALGGEIESDQGSPRSRNDKEKIKAQHKAEIKKLDDVVTAYRHRLETVEKSHGELARELNNVIEEKNSAIASLAKALKKNEELQREIERLTHENEEVHADNETLATEIERMNQLVEQYEQGLEHERKLMSDKINRYREKVSRASRVATEATLAANDATRLAREMRAVQATKTTVHETKVETVRTTKPMAQSKPKPAAKPTKDIEPKQERKVEDRVQEQVDAELKKMFPPATASTATSGPSKRKVSNSTTASRGSTRPHVKKTRMVIQEYSESESEGFAQEPEVAETTVASMHQPHMDTTFTEPSIDESRVHRETEGDVLQDDTLYSFIQSEGIATLRKEIQAERKKFEDNNSQQRQSQEAEARQAQVLANRAARRAAEEAEKAAASKKRVFIYSERDNETTITEHDENEAPHPYLRTSMIVNDVEDSDIGTVLRDIPPRPPARPGSQQTARELERRGTEEIYNEHVQEVINRLGVHKAELCTICHRKSAIEECQVKGHSGNIVNETMDVIEIPELVPVSKRMPEAVAEIPYEADITMRPSQPPKSQLDKIVKQMEDELEHLRLDYKQVEAEFLACDPSLGRRKRKSLTHQLNEMVEQIDKKADQIYALYDVAELVYRSEEEDSGTERPSSRNMGGNRLRGRRSGGQISI